MKKQLLIAAVAATMGTAAIADISLTGTGKYTYTHTETGTATTNAGVTEVNVVATGKSGDTTVVLSREFTGGDSDGDTENMYVSSKIGDVTVKAGNWTGSLTGNKGEIKDNSRSTNKLTFGTSVAGVAVSYTTTPGSASGDSVAISGTVAGMTVGIVEESDTYTDINVSGSIAGVDFRVDSYNADAANGDATFVKLSKNFDGITVSYTDVDADAGDVLTEGDGFLGTELNLAEGDVKEAQVLSASGALAGNTVTVSTGTRTEVTGEDNDFTKVVVARSLASGATLTATYIDTDNVDATTTTETFKAALSVSF